MQEFQKKIQQVLNLGKLYQKCLKRKRIQDSQTIGELHISKVSHQRKSINCFQTPERNATRKGQNWRQTGKSPWAKKTVFRGWVDFEEVEVVLFSLLGSEELKSSVPVLDSDKDLLGGEQGIYDFGKKGKEFWHNWSDHYCHGVRDQGVLDELCRLNWCSFGQEIFRLWQFGLQGALQLARDWGPKSLPRYFIRKWRQGVRRVPFPKR